MRSKGGISQKQAIESTVFNMSKAIEISKNQRVPVINSSGVHNKFLEGQSLDSLPQINIEGYKEAVKTLEKAGKSINKSHIREFLSFVRPEPIIGKLFQVIAILKGFKNPNWVK